MIGYLKFNFQSYYNILNMTILIKIAIKAIKNMYPVLIDNQVAKVSKHLANILQAYFDIIKVHSVSKVSISKKVFEDKMKHRNYRDPCMLLRMLLPYMHKSDRAKLKSFSVDLRLQDKTKAAIKTLDVFWDYLLPNWMDLVPGNDGKMVIIWTSETYKLREKEPNSLRKKDVASIWKKYVSAESLKNPTNPPIIGFGKETGRQILTYKQLLDGAISIADARDAFTTPFFTSPMLDVLHQLLTIHHLLHSQIVTITAATGLGKSTTLPWIIYNAMCCVLDTENTKLFPRIGVTQPRQIPTTNNATEIASRVYGLVSKTMSGGEDNEEIEEIDENEEIDNDNNQLTLIDSDDIDIDNQLALLNHFYKANDEDFEEDENQENVEKDPRLGRFIQYKHGDASQANETNTDKEGNEYGFIRILTDGSLYEEELSYPAWMKLPKYHAVVIDEYHEHNARMDLIAGMMRSRLRQINNTFPHRLIILSATLDDDLEPLKHMFKESLSTSPLDMWLHLEDPDREGKLTYPVTTEFHKPNKGLSFGSTGPVKEEIDFGEIKKHILQFLEEEKDGNALVFVDSKKNVHTCLQELEGNVAENVLLLPLYSGLPDRIKQALDFGGLEGFNFAQKCLIIHQPPKLFEIDSAPKYTRIVIVATRVAEASITVSGLRCVVDTGRDLLFSFSPVMGGSVSESTLISRQSYLQRKGRVGRIGPGKYIGLYDEQEMYKSKRRIDLEDQGLDPLDMLRWFHYMPIKDVLSPSSKTYIVSPKKETWEFNIKLLQFHGLMTKKHQMTLKGLETIECSRAIYEAKLFPMQTPNPIVNNAIGLAIGTMTAIRIGKIYEFVKLMRKLQEPPEDKKPAAKPEVVDCPCKGIDETEDNATSNDNDDEEEIVIPEDWSGYKILKRWPIIEDNSLTEIDCVYAGLQHYLFKLGKDNLFHSNFGYKYSKPPNNTNDKVLVLELMPNMSSMSGGSIFEYNGQQIYFDPVIWSKLSGGSKIINKADASIVRIYDTEDDIMLSIKKSDKILNWEKPRWTGSVFGISNNIDIPTRFKQFYDIFEGCIKDEDHITSAEYGFPLYYIIRNYALISKYWKKGLDHWNTADFNELGCKSKNKTFYEKIWKNANKKEQMMFLGIIRHTSSPIPPMNKKIGFQWWKDWFYIMDKETRLRITESWSSEVKQQLYRTRFSHRCSTGMMYFVVGKNDIFSLEQLRKKKEDN